ncbi:hypothetical protein DdX_02484 [Ditylenchus destructor]|uniref:F-box domain-containing protein n=1 Tax=Ditylenchus destructor TaxID=166010 RepID=A0AAD4NEA5_9BILA|nr:hypothetical protein DdX_02484 [Ditylenchus destructor]
MIFLDVFEFFNRRQLIEYSAICRHFHGIIQQGFSKRAPYLLLNTLSYCSDHWSLISNNKCRHIPLDESSAFSKWLSRNKFVRCTRFTFESNVNASIVVILKWIAHLLDGAIVCIVQIPTISDVLSTDAAEALARSSVLLINHNGCLAHLKALMTENCYDITLTDFTYLQENVLPIERISKFLTARVSGNELKRRLRIHTSTEPNAAQCIYIIEAVKEKFLESTQPHDLEFVWKYFGKRWICTYMYVENLRTNQYLRLIHESSCDVGDLNSFQLATGYLDGIL